MTSKRCAVQTCSNLCDVTMNGMPLCIGCVGDLMNKAKLEVFSYRDTIAELVAARDRWQRAAHAAENARREVEAERDALLDPEQLACLLQSYEADEPHANLPDLYDDDEYDHVKQIYPEITWEQISDWLAEAHDGDCTKRAFTCMRCVAEMVWHKAQWLAARLGE